MDIVDIQLIGSLVVIKEKTMKLNKPYSNAEYADLAVYCNQNGLIIEDKGDYLEAVNQPEPSYEEKEARVRQVRNQYLKQTDKFMLADYPITSTQKSKYKQYRAYLRDYPDSSEDWFEHEPMSFDDWSTSQTTD